MHSFYNLPVHAFFINNVTQQNKKCDWACKKLRFEKKIVVAKSISGKSKYGRKLV